MQKQTVVAEASLPSGKQGDRGPIAPEASNTTHITDSVRATSPRKDPQSQHEQREQTTNAILDQSQSRGAYNKNNAESNADAIMLL